MHPIGVVSYEAPGHVPPLDFLAIYFFRLTLQLNRVWQWQLLQTYLVTALFRVIYVRQIFSCSLCSPRASNPGVATGCLLIRGETWRGEL